MGNNNMNIMIFDVPAQCGGALTILNELHNEVKIHGRSDINWFFVVSEPELEESKNIRELRFPWVKRSWFHRLYFDFFIANRLIKKHKIDKILSLQNVIIPHTNVSQTLYVHQPLPFTEYSFGFKENRLFWIYQNVIGKMIKMSIKKADDVIVQTKWMKDVCIEQTRIDSEKIKIIPPKVKVDIKSNFIPSDSNLKTFFFPASGISYKNHAIILEATKKLKEQGIDNYRVIFTIDKDESNYTTNLYKEATDNSLPIEFMGSIPRTKVFELYTKSILLFPSYIETFGLPMLECRLHKGIIFASNCRFSKEILEGYENAYFFDPFKAEELLELMKAILLNQIKYKEPTINVVENKESGWDELFTGLVKRD